MRRLGLVVDLLLPAGAPLPAAGTIQVSPTGVALAPDTTIVAPRTHFRRRPPLFTAAPRPVLPDISNGFLGLETPPASGWCRTTCRATLSNYATRRRTFSASPTRWIGRKTCPGKAGCPALRTAGVSLVRRDTAAGLTDQFLRSVALNRFSPPRINRRNLRLSQLAARRPRLRMNSSPRISSGLSHRRFRHQGREMAVALRTKRPLPFSRRAGRAGGRDDRRRRLRAARHDDIGRPDRRACHACRRVAVYLERLESVAPRPGLTSCRTTVTRRGKIPPSRLSESKPTSPPSRKPSAFAVRTLVPAARARRRSCRQQRDPGPPTRPFPMIRPRRRRNLPWYVTSRCRRRSSCCGPPRSRANPSSAWLSARR